MSDARSVTIRSYPKTIFLYPAAITAAVCGVLSGVGVQPTALGLAFAGMLLWNLVVMSFDFRRQAPVVAGLVLVIAALLLVLLADRFPILAILRSAYEMLSIQANAGFYFTIAGIYGFVLGAILLAARFDRWEIRGNEILHHTGLLSDTVRIPSQGTRVVVEVTDVFELLLLGAGRIVIFPSGRERPIVIDNVPRVHAVEKRILDVLDSMRVAVENPA